jgi:hypothetical protein
MISTPGRLRYACTTALSAPGAADPGERLLTGYAPAPPARTDLGAGDVASEPSQLLSTSWRTGPRCHTGSRAAAAASIRLQSQESGKPPPVRERAARRHAQHPRLGPSTVFLATPLAPAMGSMRPRRGRATQRSDGPLRRQRRRRRCRRFVALHTFRPARNCATSASSSSSADPTAIPVVGEDCLSFRR